MADDDNKKTEKKVEQDDPKGAVIKSQKTDLLSGGMHQISIYQPSVIIDSHMHIQSGNCAPLPFLQGQIPLVGSALSRGWIEGIGTGTGYFIDYIKLKPAVGLVRKVAGAKPNENDGHYNKSGFRQMVPESKKKTSEVGEHFITVKRDQAYQFFQEQEQYKNLSHLVFSAVVMTMDMEYAHIDGYFGIKVYNAIYADEDTTKDPINYWYPRHGYWASRGGSYVRLDKERPLLPEKGQTKNEFGTYKETANDLGITGAYHDNHGSTKWMHINAAPFLASDKETVRYEQWKKQLDDTEQAVIANPLKLLPLFHYDPRRWQLNKNGNSDVFEHINDGGLYLGFKMYTAQGYRPWDPRLPVMEDFYCECCKKETPIMNHCTPDGAPSFDREEYFNFVHPNDTPDDQKQKGAKGKLEYFNEQFVAPDAWRQVLDRTVRGTPLNTLHICLAHFGGNKKLGREWSRQIIKMMKEKEKYPNLYADISSSFANDKFRDYFKTIMQGPDGKHIKDRILFGTDWYLTLLDGVDYLEYCRKAKESLDEYDTSLWPRFTQYNPYRFYRLDAEDQVQRIAKNIINKRQTKEMKEILPKLKQEEIDVINKEVAFIKQANKSYEICEETP